MRDPSTHRLPDRTQRQGGVGGAPRADPLAALACPAAAAQQGPRRGGEARPRPPLPGAGGN